MTTPLNTVPSTGGTFMPPNDPPNIADPFDDEFDAAMNSAPIPEDNNNHELPDGKYTWFTATVRVNKIKRGENAGKPVVNLELCVMSPQYRGELQDKTWFLTDEQAMGRFKKDLATLGIDPAALGIRYSQLLTTHVGLFLDRVVEGEVKRTQSKTDASKIYVNTYLNKYLPGVAIPPDLQQMIQANTANGHAAPSTTTGGGYQQAPQAQAQQAVPQQQQQGYSPANPTGGVQF